MTSSVPFAICRRKAGIDLAGGINLPPSFMLMIETDWLIRRCHPVWSNDKRVGVAFD